MAIKFGSVQHNMRDGVAGHPGQPGIAL